MLTGSKPLAYGDGYLLLTVGENRESVSMVDVSGDESGYDVVFVIRYHGKAVISARYSGVTDDKLVTLFEAHTGFSNLRVA